MTTEICMDAPRTVRLMRDEGGYRTYEVTHIVRGFDYGGGIYPGPAEVLFTPGLPIPGNFWIVDNDVDLWAWVRMNTSVDPYQHKSGPIVYWEVKHTVSNRPPELFNPTGAGGPGGHEEQNSPLMCGGGQIEDPLLQPQKASGGFIKDKLEAAEDRFGVPVTSSSFEQLRGPQVEFPEGYPTIHIEQNVINPRLDICLQLYNNVNSVPMWGFPVRAVRFADFKWERKYYGLCYIYYTRIFDFEIKVQKDPDNPSVFIGGWDRYVTDEGTKVRRGKWDLDLPPGPTYGVYLLDTTDPPDVNNPADYEAFKDRKGNYCRTQLRDGYPVGANALGGPTVGRRKVERYHQDNLLVKLGLPTGF